MCHLLDESVRLCVYVYMLVHVNMVALPMAYSLFTLCLLPYSTRARSSCHTDDALHSLFSLYMSSSSECLFRASFLAEIGGQRDDIKIFLWGEKRTILIA